MDVLVQGLTVGKMMGAQLIDRKNDKLRGKRERADMSISHIYSS